MIYYFKGRELARLTQYDKHVCCNCKQTKILNPNRVSPPICITCGNYGGRLDKVGTVPTIIWVTDIRDLMDTAKREAMFVTLFMGLHQRVGGASSLQAFHSTLGERNLIRVIFGMLGDYSIVTSSTEQTYTPDQFWDFTSRKHNIYPVVHN